jgi:hypothetical protein
MEMPNGTFSSEKYRFGYQGQEVDDDIVEGVLSFGLASLLVSKLPNQ